MDEPRDTPLTPFTGLFSVTRYVVVIAVIGIIFGATVMMLLGVVGIVVDVYLALTNLGPDVLEELRIALIEATDLFLVATVLFVIAAGLFQLFVNPEAGRRMPSWLQIEGLDELEERMIGMVVAVSSVVFLTLLLEWHGQFDIMGAGIAIGVVIGAASLFIFARGRGNSSTKQNHGANERD